MKSSPHKFHFAFIGGMHRSGTTALCRLIASHPRVSSLSNTGAIEDEGQYLQAVYPTEGKLGGPVRFGAHRDAHLTEHSPLVAGANELLFEAWSPFWDLSKGVLCEKTPSNLIRSRFLQAAFPTSRFVFVTRHPAAYALAVLKFDNRAGLTDAIRNWLRCHRYLMEDLPYLRHSLVLRYTDVCMDPAAAARSVETLLGLECGMDPQTIKGGLNNSYFKSWREGDYRLWAPPRSWRNVVKQWRNQAEIAYVEHSFESAVNAFGYSFRELN